MAKNLLILLISIFAVTGFAKGLDAKNRAILDKFLMQENIFKVTPIQDRNLGLFVKAYLKIPPQVRQYMLENGAAIHIMEGSGVGVDPTWLDRDRKTMDARDWTHVPGAGGYPYWGPAYPTRIAINHLSGNHGSVNLVLHEYAHALDSAESLHRFSKSSRWLKLFQEQSTQDFLLKTCGEYCVENAGEAFAEVFAYFNHDQESRKRLMENAANLHGYMIELTSVYVRNPNHPF